MYMLANKDMVNLLFQSEREKLMESIPKIRKGAFYPSSDSYFYNRMVGIVVQQCSDFPTGFLNITDDPIIITVDGRNYGIKLGYIERVERNVMRLSILTEYINDIGEKMKMLLSIVFSSKLKLSGNGTYKTVVDSKFEVFTL